MTRCKLPDGAGVLPAFLVEGGCISAEFYTTLLVDSQEHKASLEQTA